MDMSTSLASALGRFGLTDREVQVYEGLVQSGGATTALALSRRTPIKRSTIYRILEQLKSKGLVFTQIGDKTTYYVAADANQFESLVSDYEQQAESLRQALPSLVAKLTSSRQTSYQTELRFFEGIRGMKQMQWRLRESKDANLLIFDAEKWDILLGKPFAESIREAVVQNNIVIYELQNPPYARPIPPSGRTDWTDNVSYVKHHYRHRKLPNNLMTISQDIYIFPPRVHIYGYRHNDLFGIEIESRDFAQMLKEVFWQYWRHASIIDRFGSIIKHKSLST